MAQISPQHVTPLAMGFIGLLVFAILGMGALNYAANH